MATLIVLGEGFFKLVVTLADKGIYKVSPEVVLNFVFSGFSIFIMCWMYFDFTGNAKPKNNRMSAMVKLWLGHLAVPYVSAIVGNMLWLTALFSQGVVPYILAVKTYSTE